jgi:hypothetical protein
MINVTATIEMTRLMRGLEQLDGVGYTRPAMREALGDLERYAKQIVHVDTGRLRRTLHVEGPMDIGAGTLEGVVTPDPVPYAIYEVRRGGEHDYAGRTLRESRQIINDFAQRLEADALETLRRAR